MIDLFHIKKPIVDLSKFENIVHDKVVTEFEDAFAKYVGAKYAVAVNSATNAIFLSLKSLDKPVTCHIPSLITTRFLNAIEMAGCDYLFMDNPEWVGDKYFLHIGVNTIIDSAQSVQPGFHNHIGNDAVIYSFYPTKPIGGIQGGMVVSNDKTRIDWIRQAAHFGEKLSSNTNSWESSTDFKGYQMFMGTIPAYVAFENLKRYPEKRAKLDYVRERYNSAFNSEYIVTNNSNHLYRIRSIDNEKAVREAYSNGIVFGIHYKPAHLNTLYGDGQSLPKSEKDGREVVSIPFHEKLTDKEIDTVIKEVKKLC